MRSGWLVPVIVVSIGCYLAVMFGVLDNLRSKRGVVRNGNVFYLEARGTREYPGDYSAAQVFELVNVVGGAVKLGRLTTSCGCIALTSAKSEYGAGEKIEVVLRNVRPSSGKTYAFFVHILEPVTTVLQQEVYVISKTIGKEN